MMSIENQRMHTKAYLCAILLIIFFWAMPAWAQEASPGSPGSPASLEKQTAADPIAASNAPDAPDADTPSSQDQPEAIIAPRVALFTLTGRLPDQPPRYTWLDHSSGKPRTLMGLITRLDEIAGDDNYVGIVLYLDRPAISLSAVYELSKAIERVRQSGIKVVAFSEQYSMPAYLLACSMDAIVLQENGRVDLHGLGVEEMYLLGLLDKIGIKADLLQVGSFKGARDNMTRVGPSPQWSQTFDALLDDLYSQIVSTISQKRKLSLSKVERLFADGWTLQGKAYVQSKVVDFIANRDLTDVSRRLFGDDFVWDNQHSRGHANQAMENPFALFQRLFKPRKTHTQQATIAIIHATGAITSGKSQDGSFFGGKSIGSHTMVQTLRRVKEDPLIEGAVIRLNSPGGSALASEIIWQAVHELAQTKPVYISIHNMAASGGYYIACAGDQIFASPSAIIGSIGVVGGKLALGGLYEKIGVTVYHRGRGPLAGMFNSASAFTPGQRVILKKAFEQTYDLFVDRVTQGRGNKITNVDDIAQGRIFTGKQGKVNGMVDHLGSVGHAVAQLAVQVGLSPGNYDVIHLPEPGNLTDFLEDFFESQTASPLSQHAAIELAKHVIGPGDWPAVQMLIQGLLQLRNEPVLTLLPAAIIVK